MGDDHELRLLLEPLHDLDEPVDVRFIERRVELIQHAERAGLDHVDGEEQRDRRHGAFAARKQADRLRLLAGGTRHDIDAALQRVAFVQQGERGFATAEEFREHLLEIDLHLLEGVREELLRGAVDFLDRLENLVLGREQISLLAGEEFVAFFQFVVLGDRLHVDRTDGIERAPLLQHLGLQYGPIGRGIGFGQFGQLLQFLLVIAAEPFAQVA